MARYLLGEMPESERAGFEAQFAADRNLFDELVDVENDLVDSYAAGGLTQAEREQFDRYYLATPKRRRRAELAKSVVTYFDRMQPAVERARDERRGGLSSITPALRPSFPIGKIAAALVSFLLAVATGFLAVSNMQLRRELAETADAQASLQKATNALEQQIAAVTQQLQDLTGRQKIQPPQGPDEVAVLTLSPGLARSGENENRIIISPLVTVRLQLKLDQRHYLNYGVSLETPEGVPLWQTNGLASKTTRQHGRVVVMDVPARVLKRGDYILRLSGIKAGGSEETVDAYSFRADTRH